MNHTPEHRKQIFDGINEDAKRFESYLRNRRDGGRYNASGDLAESSEGSREKLVTAANFQKQLAKRIHSAEASEDTFSIGDLLKFIYLSELPPRYKASMIYRLVTPPKNVKNKIDDQWQFMNTLFDTLNNVKSRILALEPPISIKNNEIRKLIADILTTDHLQRIEDGGSEAVEQELGKLAVEKVTQK